MKKVVYRGFSLLDFFKAFLFRIGTGALMVSALLHFDENPVVISIVAVLCFCCIFFFGDDQVIVYENRVVQKTNSIASYIFNFKGEVYSYLEIEEAYLDNSIPDVYSSVVIALLSFISKKRGSDNVHPIFLRMKDGNIKEIPTSLDIYKREKIVDAINTVLAQRSKSRKVAPVHQKMK